MLDTEGQSSYLLIVGGIGAVYAIAGSCDTVEGFGTVNIQGGSLRVGVPDGGHMMPGVELYRI